MGGEGVDHLHLSLELDLLSEHLEGIAPLHDSAAERILRLVAHDEDYIAFGGVSPRN